MMDFIRAEIRGTKGPFYVSYYIVIFVANSIFQHPATQNKCVSEVMALF